MTTLRSDFVPRNYKVKKFILSILLAGILLLSQSLFIDIGYCKIIIDIDNPSIQKINIAIPDFKNFSKQKEHPEFITKMPDIISSDLYLSGYFMPMDKEAFLDEDGPLLSADNINFKNWTVIGSELLLKGGYTCIGRSIEVEVRLYDIFWGRQILGKKFLGKIEDHRHLMHRIGNEIVRTLTGVNGVFLTRFAFVNSKERKYKEIFISDFDGHNIKKVTSDKSIALLPEWSPQGGNLIFTSYKEGGPMLYMKGLTSGKVGRISGKKGLNIGACYVPNSKNMALTLSFKGNPDIYIINQKGEILKRITNHWAADLSPTFSPDGKTMAFVSDRSGDPQIFIKDLVSGKVERLTFEGKNNTSPAWSSMNRIAFCQMQDSVVDLFTMNPDGTNQVRLTGNQGNNEDPSWSPDGRYIVFSSNRTGQYHLYIMNANGQNQNRIVFLEGEQTAPSWSPF